MEDDKKQAFLEEYEELCKRHQMIVSSCGCCNSPWVVSVSNADQEKFQKYISEHIEELREKDIVESSVK